MEPAALRRARTIRDWAPCAPRFVHAEIKGILKQSKLPAQDRSRLEGWLVDLHFGEPGTWFCRFPALAGADAPSRLEGGLLCIVATDPGIHPPRGSESAAKVLEGAGVAHGPDLHLVGLPTQGGLKVVGESAAGAIWLAHRARSTSRPVPPNIVVSAALAPGPDGEPRLVAVAGGTEKARVVARELPEARLFLCGEAEGNNVVVLPEGAPVRELERLIWGSGAVMDRSELLRTAGLAKRAFDDHDYATAAVRYRSVAEAAGKGDEELGHEACLRLAALEIHEGRSNAAEGWLKRLEVLEDQLPRSKRGVYAVERLGTLAGQAIDGFRPAQARAFLETDVARRAASDASDTWKQIQIRGAWRRLHLLSGSAEEARHEQGRLLEATEGDALEGPRALLDLGFVETRCGDLHAARRALLGARDGIQAMPPIYALQSRAFLTWHVARFAKRGGDLAGLDDLLGEGALRLLLAEPQLQAAGRWRLQALRATSDAEIDSLAEGLTSFQRWYLGVFLLESPETMGCAWKLLASSPLDLAGVPPLAQAREALREGQLNPAAFLTHAAY